MYTSERQEAPRRFKPGLRDAGGRAGRPPPQLPHVLQAPEGVAGAPRAARMANSEWRIVGHQSATSTIRYSLFATHRAKPNATANVRTARTGQRADARRRRHRAGVG